MNLDCLRKILWKIPLIKEYLLSRKVQKINRKKGKQVGFISTDLLLRVIIPFFTVGWVWNIVKLFNELDNHSLIKMVFRLAGIALVPLGAIFGYL